MCEGRWVFNYDWSCPPLELFSGSPVGRTDSGSLWWWLAALTAHLGVYLFCSRRRPWPQPYVIAGFMCLIACAAVPLLRETHSRRELPIDWEPWRSWRDFLWLFVYRAMFYSGIAGFTVPFLLSLGGLVRGNPNAFFQEQTRRWLLWAWGCLTIAILALMRGNYEAHGPAPNPYDRALELAALLPWVAVTACLLSTVVAERRGVQSAWNLLVMCATFFLVMLSAYPTTHWYVGGTIAALGVGVIAWRFPRLRSTQRAYSGSSRLGVYSICSAILLVVAALLAEAIAFRPRDAAWVAYGGGYFRTWAEHWAPPLVCVVATLMSLAPLLPWHTAPGKTTVRAFVFPALVAAGLALVHGVMGSPLGYSDGLPGRGIPLMIMPQTTELYVVLVPWVATILVGFNLGVMLQAMCLRQWNRRAFAAHAVFLGAGLVLLGIAGRVWDSSDEATLAPGHTGTLHDHQLTYRSLQHNPSPNPCTKNAQPNSPFGHGSVHLMELVPPGGAVNHAVTSYAIHTSQYGESGVVHVNPRLHLIVYENSDKSGEVTFVTHHSLVGAWIWVGAMLLVGGMVLWLWLNTRRAWVL